MATKREVLHGLKKFVQHANRDPDYLQTLVRYPEKMGAQKASKQLAEARMALIIAASQIGVMDCVAGG